MRWQACDNFCPACFRTLLEFDRWSGNSKVIGEMSTKSLDGSHEKDLLQDIGLSLCNKLEDCIDGWRDKIWLATRRRFFRSDFVFWDVPFDFSSKATIILGLPLCRASHMNMMWPPALTGFHNFDLCFPRCSQHDQSTWEITSASIMGQPPVRHRFLWRASRWDGPPIHAQYGLRLRPASIYKTLLLTSGLLFRQASHPIRQCYPIGFFQLYFIMWLSCHVQVPLIYTPWPPALAGFHVQHISNKYWASCLVGLPLQI